MVRHIVMYRLKDENKEENARQMKEKAGVKKPGDVRAPFIIDKAGVLRHALYGVTPKGHALEVLALVKQLD